jgi:hypothetical protein
MKLFPNIFELFKILVRKISGRADVFTVEVILQNMVDDLVAFFHFEFVKVQQET